MKWAYQILSNISGISPGIYQVKTKRYATERAKLWASVLDLGGSRVGRLPNRAYTRVLKQKDFDPADFVRGWEIIEEIAGESNVK
jgi:hypothetical protein